MKEEPSTKFDSFKSISEIQTKGVKTLLGHPKKAIIKLSLPMIVAMFAITIYYLADAIWVSGISAEALAAVGFVFPFFFMAMALATGLGTGGGAAVSRRIGAKDKKGADSVAVHTLIIMLIVSISFTIPFFVFAEDIFDLIGAGETTALAVTYARILAIGAAIVFFTFVANDLLRSEGDVKRAMIAIALGAGLNIILDPIFIFTLDFGIAGAAYATLIAMSIASALLFYWLFLKKDTYLSFVFRNFHFNKSIIKDILRVGFPASLQQLSMSIMMLIMNIIIVGVGSTDGVAIFSAGWRIATMAIIPLLAIATAVVSVTGAAYGAHDYKKLNIAYMYALKIGIFIEIIISVLIFLLAPIITALFTQAEGSSRLVDEMTHFLRIMCIYYPIVVFATLSASMFQGTGKGTYALIISAIRNLMLIPLLSLIFSITFNMGLEGIWWGIVVANIIGPSISFIWAKFYIRNLMISRKPA